MPMAISPNFSLFILSIFLFFSIFFPITQSSNNINNTSLVLIHKTCKKIVGENPNISFNFCLRSLQAAAKHNRCTDLRRLGLVLIGLVRSNVTSTRHHITKLIRNKKLNPFVKSCLSDCLELYSDAILSVKQAMRDYRLKRYDDANVRISSVMDAASTCEDGFKEKKKRGVVVSPLTKRNGDAFQLGAIALAIMSLLR